MNDDYTAHINQMERDAQAQRAEFDRQQMSEAHKTEQAKAQARTARWQHISMAVGWLALAATVLGTFYIIWQASAGPSSDDLIRQQDRAACIEAGGTYFANPSSNSSDIVCVMPGANTR